MIKIAYCDDDKWVLDNLSNLLEHYQKNLKSSGEAGRKTDSQSGTIPEIGMYLFEVKDNCFILRLSL